MFIRIFIYSILQSVLAKQNLIDDKAIDGTKSEAKCQSIYICMEKSIQNHESKMNEDSKPSTMNW